MRSLRVRRAGTLRELVQEPLDLLRTFLALRVEQLPDFLNRLVEQPVNQGKPKMQLRPDWRKPMRGVSARSRMRLSGMPCRNASCFTTRPAKNTTT